MFYPPTCVGLRYGHSTLWLEAFLGSMASISLLSPEGESFHSVLSSTHPRICLRVLPTTLEDALHLET
jgi:hypothetical protein